MKKRYFSGAVFGFWTIINDSGSRTKSGEIKYLCKCICGTEKIITGTALGRGRIEHCGCRKYQHLIGKKHNKLTILSVDHKNKVKLAHCKCDCGNEKTTRLWGVVSGKTKSCGCTRSRSKVGKKYGKLLVVEKARHIKGHVVYLCKCDCGKEKEIRGNNLRVGGSISCGCTRRTSNKGRKYKSYIDKKDRLINQKYAQYRKGAVNRHLAFNLSKELFSKLLFGSCFYCGVVGASNVLYGVQYNGVDRIDNNKGYLESNCVTCCKQCNYAKGILPLDEFYSWVARLVAHTARSYVE